MWYVIQTETGHEQLLIEMLKKLPGQTKDNCFYIKREEVWRIGGEYKIHEEMMFPGYVFIQTQRPEKLYHSLKQIPRLTKILGKEEYDFHPLPKEEEYFLKRLLNDDKDNTVRLSKVQTDEEGNIISCDKPLRYFEPCVIKKRIRQRFVIIRITLLGRDREVKLGICLEGDRREET